MDKQTDSVPYDLGVIELGNGHELYWECHGNPDGRPAVYFHGGPGGGFNRRIPRMFPQNVYRIVLYDQRGCGKSVPLASAANADLSTNTTQQLIADVELLRERLGVDKWTILGLSWGTTLG